MPRKVTKQTLTAALVSGVFVVGAGLSACSRTESTASLLAEAKQYQQKGDNKAALIQLKNAVAKSPEDGEARIQLATLYSETNDMVSTEKETRKAMSLGVQPERTLPLLAQALLAQGQFQKVLDEIKPEQAKNSAALLTARADAHMALSEAPKAKESYEQALALTPNHGDALTGMARYAMLQKDVDGANRYAAEAVAKDAKNPETWMFKASMLRAQGKTEEALAAYDQALLLNPAHRTAHIEKAHLEIGLGKFDMAKADLDAARKVAPGSMTILYTQALLDFTQGKHAAAQESIQKVLRSAPEHMPSLLLAGAVELQLGSTQQAEQHLRKYLGAFPSNVYARKLLAQTLLKSAQPADAVAALAPALKEPAQDPQLLALAGESYMQVKDFKQASAYFTQASALAPKMAMLHTSLGLSKLGQGDSAKAISELELGATLDGKTLQGGIALIRAELSLKHYDKALAAVLALEKQQPDNAVVQNLKGGVYLAKGDTVNARVSFEKALTQQPGFFAAAANLAQLDMQAKNPAAAKKRFEAVLEKDKKNIEAMNALADLAASQGQSAEATTWLERASNENPEAIGPAIRLASIYLRTKEPQKALTVARKFQTANPTNPELLDLLGQTQLANNDAAGALETYSKLVNVAPKSAQAQFRLASVHMALKNEAAAADDLKKAVSLQPDFMPALLAQIELAMRKDRPDDAVAIARQIQKLPGQQHTGMVIEADLLLKQGKPALALPLSEKAFALTKSPQLMITIHRLMTQTGKAKEAEQRLAQWMKEHPSDVLTAMYVAEGNIAKKQYKLAITQLEAIVKLTPKNPAALNNLAWTYQQENNPKSLETAEEAYRQAGDNPSVMDTLATILTARGDTKRSVALLQKATGLAPNDLELRLHLAQALAKSGDKVNARKEVEQIIAKGNGYSHLDEAKELLKQL